MQHDTTSPERRAAQRRSADLGAWVRQNLEPFWPLWPVAFLAGVAFVAVILWFAL